MNHKQSISINYLCGESQYCIINAKQAVVVLHSASHQCYSICLRGTIWATSATRAYSARIYFAQIELRQQWGRKYWLVNARQHYHFYILRCELKFVSIHSGNVERISLSRSAGYRAPPRHLFERSIGSGPRL